MERVLLNGDNSRGCWLVVDGVEEGDEGAGIEIGNSLIHMVLKIGRYRFILVNMNWYQPVPTRFLACDTGFGIACKISPKYRQYWPIF